MSFWNTSEGSKIGSETSAELGGSSEPIPEGEHCKAMITDAKWDTYEGETCIKLRWDVIEGSYNKRVVFHKVKVNESDAKKADKHKRMLAAIDANCGGKLMAAGVEPTDMSLATNLCNKPMIIRVGVWEMGGKAGNWVQAVMSAGAGVVAPKAASTQTHKSAAIPKGAPDDDIPF